MGVLIFAGSVCPASHAPAITTLGPVTAGSSSPFSYSVTLTGGLTSGSYSAQVEDGSADLFGVCVPFTVMSSAPPIPEYPLGLPLLAILTVIAYGVIRRRTRNDHD